MGARSRLHVVATDLTADTVRQHGRTTSDAVDQLRTLIVSGTLAAGQRIPERWISERTGLTRTPLREALKVLAAEGLVRIEPNRGAVVASLSVAEIEATLVVLVGLEALASEPCCDLIGEAGIAELACLQDELVAHHAAGDLMPYFAVNQSIHQMIVDAAGNPVLSRIYETESRRLRRYRFAGNRDPARWADAVREHDDMLRAIRRRDGALLREIMRAHLRNGWAISRDLLSRELTASGAAPKQSGESEAPRLRRPGARLRD